MLNALDLTVFALQSRAVTDVTRALEQLDEIQTRIARTEVYRGWRSAPVALSGLAGIAAAIAQPAVQGVRATDPLAWVLYWFAVALVALAIGCGGLLWRYLREESLTEQRRTQQVLAQFLPALAAAACITVGLLRVNPALASCLPGLWSVLFSVGIFSARPHLPTAAAMVSAFYAIAGVTMLWTLGARSPAGIAPWLGWTVGGVFGAGQLIAAAALYWSLERDSTFPEGT